MRTRALILPLLTATLLAGACGGGGAVETSAPPSPTEVRPTAEISYHPIGSTHLKKGNVYFAVYLAVGDAEDPTLSVMATKVADLGIKSVLAPLTCDARAAKALHAAPSKTAVAVYFKTYQDAQSWASELGFPTAGTARVRALCGKK